MRERKRKKAHWSLTPHTSKKLFFKNFLWFLKIYVIKDMDIIRNLYTNSHVKMHHNVSLHNVK